MDHQNNCNGVYMHIGVIVSEFPKVTETFVLRNIQVFLEQKHAVSVFHLKPFRTQEKVHCFAKPILKLSYYQPFILSWQVLFSCLLVLIMRPIKLIILIYSIICGCKGDWKTLFKTLAIIPKALAYGRHTIKHGIEHIHAEFAGLPATTGWIISKIYDLPFSFSCHAHDIFISQTLLNIKVHDSEFVRVISKYNKDFLLQHISCFDQNKIKIIRCGVTVEDKLDTKKNKVMQDTFSLLYVGSLVERKGVDNLLMALSRLPHPKISWTCKIIGDGSQRKDLEDLTIKLGLIGRVEFVGSQTYEYICKAYTAADTVVVPSIVGPEGRCEGIPVVIMEALAFGCPTISTEISGIPELLEDSVTGFLTHPGDVRELSDKIQWIFDNFSDALLISRVGRERVLSEYNITINARQLLNTIINHTPQRGT